MANRNVARAVRLALVTAGALGAGLYGMTGAAQEQLQEIVVTGSRIPQPNIEGTSPVTVVSSLDVKVSGVTKVEDLVNKLPQVFATQGGNVSNGASGTATVDLRGLGSERTLVLMNGRRLQAGDVFDLAPDLNAIPAPLIQRVEILTGGASAVYGSDAVSGVVNFIMKDNFEGAQFDFNYNFYNHDQGSTTVANLVRARGGQFFQVPGDKDADGAAFEASVLLGSNFADGRGNATVFLGYREVKALLQSERDYSSCALGSAATDGLTNTQNEPSSFVCGGSGTSYPGRFIDLNDGQNWTLATGGGIRPYVTSDQYNYGPLNYYQRPDERYAFNAFAHYDINDSATVYTELTFHDNPTVAQIAPSGLFGWLGDISCANPLFTAAWRTELCTNNGLTLADDASLFIFRRNVEGGGRQDNLRHTSFREVLGIRGSFAEHWDYDVYASYGSVVFQESYANDFSITRSGRAMDVIPDPVTGAPVCRSVVDGTDPNCVPYNIWSLGGVTPEALAYLQTPGFQRGETSQTVVSGTMSADLGSYGFKLPSASHGVGVAFGAEYREEQMVFTTDTAFSTGDLFGQGGPSVGTGGQYNLMDLFLETRVPIADSRPGIESLSLNASYRYSDYSTGVTTSTYGAGIDWAPIEDIKFRGSYQRAVRAPNIAELFRAVGVGLYDNDFDPCAGAVPVATLAQCQRTGVTAAQYGTIIDSPAQQYNALFGGNVNLSPEKSDSYTIGLVFTPTFLEGFSMTVDFFNIKVEDVISTLSPPTILSECLATGNPDFCSLINRDQLGTLWALPTGYIVATNLNLSTYETSGFDLTMNYRHDIGGWGSLTWNLNGTYLDTLEVEEYAGLGTYDCAGLYGSGVCGISNPEWRHNARVTWATPWNLDVSLTWRYFDKVLFERTSSNPLLSGNYNSVDREMKAMNYIDLAGSWTVAEKYTVGLGINNVFDQDPPLSSQVGAGFGNGNTFPQVYDALGRFVFMNLSAKF